ncbi:MAG: hypothetical protein NZ937_01145 [Armatimonadetes bacterium]|nr:hypothetical protein [Armatimonadota bacterium]
MPLDFSAGQLALPSERFLANSEGTPTGVPIFSVLISFVGHQSDLEVTPANF